MKYLKKFEHFTGHDLGRFSDEEETKDYMTHPDENDQAFDQEEMYSDEDELKDEISFEDEREEEDGRVWGDEVVEGKKSKPDFLDLDKDGNKKESMKKAAKDAKDKKEDKKEDKSGKGLTAAQKKLPEGLRKAIEAKKKK
jgi:hypothetical protein